MVALKSSRLSALLVAFALVLSFFGALQLLTTRTASATALACPAPTTNVNNKVDLDWDNLQLRPLRSWRRPVPMRLAWASWLESSRSRVCLWLQPSAVATDDGASLRCVSASGSAVGGMSNAHSAHFSFGAS